MNSQEPLLLPVAAPWSLCCWWTGSPRVRERERERERGGFGHSRHDDVIQWSLFFHKHNRSSESRATQIS